MNAQPNPTASFTPCTAVLISGQARRFADCFASQHWQVYRKLHNPHFFVSVVDDAEADQMEMLRQRHANVFIERVTQPEMEEKEVWKLAAFHAPFQNSVPMQSFLRQYWHLKRVFKFSSEQMPAGVRAVSFIRMRPDSYMQEFEPPAALNHEQVLVPWWGNYGGANDRIACIAGLNAAAVYFSAIDSFDELCAQGCPFHPESLLAAWLQAARVPLYRTLHAEFKTLYAPGDDRQERPPIYYAGDIFKYVQAEQRRQNSFVLPPARPSGPPAASR